MSDMPPESGTPAPPMPRTMHRNVFIGNGQHVEGVMRACREAEAEGMVMVGTFPIDQWNVCVTFVGAEELFR